VAPRDEGVITRPDRRDDCAFFGVMYSAERRSSGEWCRKTQTQYDRHDEGDCNARVGSLGGVEGKAGRRVAGRAQALGSDGPLFPGWTADAEHENGRRDSRGHSGAGDQIGTGTHHRRAGDDSLHHFPRRAAGSGNRGVSDVAAME